MKKKKDSFKFHYKDESREIRITASSKSVERFCKPQKEIVQPACQSRKDKVERNITIIVSVLTIIGFIYKTICFFYDLFMHICFQENRWISKHPVFMEYQV